MAKIFDASDLLEKKTKNEKAITFCKENGIYEDDLTALSCYLQTIKDGNEKIQKLRKQLAEAEVVAINEDSVANIMRNAILEKIKNAFVHKNTEGVEARRDFCSKQNLENYSKNTLDTPARVLTLFNDLSKNYASAQRVIVKVRTDYLKEIEKMYNTLKGYGVSEEMIRTTITTKFGERKANDFYANFLAK